MLLATALSAATVFAAPRPPAVPLVVCDPSFSLWSFSDTLNTDWPRHWTGSVQALFSMARVDGAPYLLMGGMTPDGVKRAEQVGLEVRPTRTIYQFKAGPVGFTLTFLTAALPDDLDLLSRPVGYLTWRAVSLDGAAHAVQLYYDNSLELVVDKPDQAVVWSRPQLPGLTVLRGGTAAQPVLAKSGDNLRCDWGWLYAASADPCSAVAADDGSCRGAFAGDGSLPDEDDRDQPRACSDRWPLLAFRWDLGNVAATPVERRLVLAYDDLLSVEYLGRRLGGYWRRNGWGAAELLKASFAEYPAIDQRCAKLDAELTADLTAVGGPRYAELATLAFRQGLGGHKLVADNDGTPLWFSKECFSNGCIATVDVTYPTAPLPLCFSPKLMRALLEPIVKYAASPRWPWPFAPHDLGTFPLANGQVYGGGERTEENQMPVEESGNLLILAAAHCRAANSVAFAQQYWSVLTRWAEYLKAHGLDPENQLCTDDFSGHLAHNANLSIKAILGLGCYAQLAAKLGHEEDARAYRALAEGFVTEWIAKADDGDHFRLAFDRAGTWSQKYNLVWDRILDLKLFPPEVARKEVAFYRHKLGRYGLPLDNRSLFTKTDWCLWSATLAETRADFEAMVGPVCDFANESPSRVPLTDWYWTDSAKQQGFQARPVVGGLFIKLLADPALWRKWCQG
jgi:hypothetical protein